MSQTNLRPRIVVQGGLGKTGAIAEGDEKTEYINATYVRLTFKNIKLQHVVSFGKEKVFGDDAKAEEPLNSNQQKLVDDWIALHKGVVPSGLAENVSRGEGFMGKAEIENSRFGKFKLSLFGSSQKFSSLSVTIRRGSRDVATMGGIKGLADADVTILEGFFCDIYLSGEHFDEIKKLYIYGLHAELNMQIDISNAPGFYAAHSDLIGEGRVVKYLSSVRDLENPEVLPKYFNDGSGHFSLPFSISVNTPDCSDTFHDDKTVSSADFGVPEIEAKYPEPQTHEMNRDFFTVTAEKKILVELSNIRNAIVFVGIIIVAAILY